MQGGLNNHKNLNTNNSVSTDTINDNLVDYKLIGSRIEVHLKDYSKLDKEKLKSAGVDGFILMSNKLTLVLKGDAKEVYKKIFNDWI